MMRSILYFIVLFLVHSSCTKSMENSVSTSPLGEFDTLTLNSVFDVELVQGNENTIQIEGAKKIVEQIEVKVVNNSLILENSFKGNWVHPKKNKIKITITTNGIARINANETC